MPKYNVTVQFSGTKTYEIESGHPDQVEFLFEQWSTFDSYDNPIDDSVSETIVRIEEIPEEPEPETVSEPDADTLFLALRNLYADYANYYPSAVENSPAMKAVREILENGR